MIEPELIEIIEGPTPEFQPTPQSWLQSLYEGPTLNGETSLCRLRTATGADIVARCQRAWAEGRPVRLDFPDELRMRRQVDVVAVRRAEVSEGELLLLWVVAPFEMLLEEEEAGDDDDDDLLQWD